MKIEFEQRVKHAGRTYEAGDRVTVDDVAGNYFCSCGWAKRLDGDTPPASPPPGNVTLDVQNSQIGHLAENIGS